MEVLSVSVNGIAKSMPPVQHDSNVYAFLEWQTEDDDACDVNGMENCRCREMQGQSGSREI
jgi:hypothetical protein